MKKSQEIVISRKEGQQLYVVVKDFLLQNQVFPLDYFLEPLAEKIREIEGGIDAIQRKGDDSIVRVESTHEG